MVDRPSAAGASLVLSGGLCEAKAAIKGERQTVRQRKSGHMPQRSAMARQPRWKEHCTSTVAGAERDESKTERERERGGQTEEEAGGTDKKHSSCFSFSPLSLTLFLCTPSLRSRSLLFASLYFASLRKRRHKEPPRSPVQHSREPQSLVRLQSLNGRKVAVVEEAAGLVYNVHAENHVARAGRVPAQHCGMERGEAATQNCG